MKTVVPLICIFTTLVAVLVIFGWLLDISFLKTLLPGAITMKFSTALSFLSSSTCLWFIYRQEMYESTWADVVIPVTTLSIMILMGVILFSIIFGFTTGFDDLFVEPTAESLFSNTPGRPSLATMISFFSIAAMAMASMSGESWKFRVRFYLFLGLGVSLTGAVALTGYALGMPLLYYAYLGVSNAMAIHTAGLFFLMGVGFQLLGWQVTRKNGKAGVPK